MTDAETVMEAMHTVARVIQPEIVAIGKGACGDLALGPHEKAIAECGKGRIFELDEGTVMSIPRLDILCIDLPRDDLARLIYCLKQNGYAWTKGVILPTPILREHSHYEGDYHLYVKTTFND